MEQLTLLVKQAGVLVEWDTVRRYVLERYGPRAVRAKLTVRPLYTTDSGSTDALVTHLVAYDAEGQVCEYDLTLPFFQQESVRAELLHLEIQESRGISLHDRISPIDRGYWEQEGDVVSYVDWFDLPTSRREWDVTTPPPFYFIVVPVTEQEAVDAAQHRATMHLLQHIVENLYAMCVHQAKGTRYASSDSVLHTS